MRETGQATRLAATTVIVLGSFFLGGCYNNQSQDQVLQNAPQFDVKKFDERQPEDPNAASRLSVGIPQGGQQQAAPPTKPSNNNPKQPPAMQIDTNKSYSAVLKTTEGDITIDLDVKKTPITANNFVALAKEKFYDNTIFHRVIKGFMIQGGDPKGDGSGGPGYSFADESLEGSYTRGTVAMANSGPNTNGSQFFIMHQDYALPNSYVIFGHVSQGLDAVDKIASAEVTVNGSMENSKPVNPVKINSVEIAEK